MKKENFKKICHFAAGLLVLPYAYSFFEQKKFFVSGVFLSVGVLFILFIAAYDWFEKKLGDIVKLFFLLEALFFAFGIVVFIGNGQKKPALIYLGAGIFFFSIFLYYLYNRDKSKRHRRKKHSSHHHSTHKHRHHKHKHSNDEVEQ